MKHLERVIMTIAVCLLLALLGTACQGDCSCNDGDGDAGTDTDTDADSDTDTDTGTGSDTNPVCGGLDQLCCEEEPTCNDNDLIAVNYTSGSETQCYCFARCTVNLCTVGGDPIVADGGVDGGFTEEVVGYCNDPYSGGATNLEDGNCINTIDFPNPFEYLYTCVEEETGCMTNGGETEGTICMSLVAGTICLETCTLPDPLDPATMSCDIAHDCRALTSSGEYNGNGACVPAG